METFLPTIDPKPKQLAVTKASLMQLRSIRTELENGIRKWMKRDCEEDLHALSQDTYAALQIYEMMGKNARYGVKQRIRKLYRVHRRIRQLEFSLAQRRMEQLQLAIK